MRGSWLWRAAYLLTRPDYLARAFLRRWPGASFPLRLEWDAVDRPAYAYGVYQAAIEARGLGLDKISVIEFGVAGGAGLVALETIAAEVSKALNVSIDVYGFDAERGMPAAADYRDVPYLWREGDFRMDHEKLKSCLRNARLILGPVDRTVPEFLPRYRPAPVGFVSFDLDYYSSTMTAFNLWDGEPAFFLPRTFCYFDDIGPGISEHAGEFQAIKDFNSERRDKKIDPIKWLSFTRRIPSLWNQRMYVLHDFNHPLYARPPETGQQLPLDS